MNGLAASRGKKSPRAQSRRTASLRIVSAFDIDAESKFLSDLRKAPLDARCCFCISKKLLYQVELQLAHFLIAAKVAGNFAEYVVDFGELSIGIDQRGDTVFLEVFTHL